VAAAEVAAAEVAAAEVAAAEAPAKMAVKAKKRVQRPASKYRTYDYTPNRKLCIYDAMIIEQVILSIPLFHAKRWLILPTLHLGVERYIFLMNKHHISGILRQIKRDSARIKNYPPPPQLFPTPYDITEEMLSYARNLAIVNNKVRNRFQYLARRWKTSRLKKANTEDLLTGEEPKQCIRLRDYKNRSEYVFEADTIHKDMYERLLQHYYTFPEPVAPRNPYTNELLTFAQFFNVMRQLYKVPGKKIHWALDALFSSSYDIALFQNRMSSRLRQALVQRIMSTPANDTGTEVLIDFIEDCFNQTTLITSEHDIQYRTGLYKWAARNLPTHPQLCRWRTACYSHQLHRINTIPPTFEQKRELNAEISYLIVLTPDCDLQTPYNILLATLAPTVQAAATLDSDDSDAWEEFDLTNIYIIATDTSLFEVNG